MTTDELRDVLSNAVTALRSNQEIVTPALLDGLETLVARVQEEPMLLGSVAGLLRMDQARLVQILPRMRDVIAVERRLIGGLGPKLIESLERLRGRNIVLALVAKFL